MKKLIISMLLVFAMLPIQAIAAAGYTDVDASYWAVPFIQSVTDKKLMEGHGNGKFGPKETLTEAQVAQIGYNAYGSVLTGNFETVVTGKWYADAMNWANGLGLMDSSTPENPATRELVALVFFRLASELGVKMPETSAPIAFSDISNLSSESKDAIAALQKAGVIMGDGDGTYAPARTLIRAEIAKIIDVFTDIPGLFEFQALL